MEISHPEGRRWYVVYSKPYKEELAQFYLRLKGVEVFFPQLLLPESAKKRRRITPLFPNYLFVNIFLPKEYHYVIWSPGVKSLVSFNGGPVPVDDGIITFLRQEATPAGVIVAYSNLKVGQEVIVTRGPFEGLVGIIQEPPNARGRVKVLMRLLSREVKVELPTRFVDTGWVARSPTAEQRHRVESLRYQ